MRVGAVRVCVCMRMHMHHARAHAGGDAERAERCPRVPRFGAGPSCLLFTVYFLGEWACGEEFAE